MKIIELSLSRAILPLAIGCVLAGPAAQAQSGAQAPGSGGAAASTAAPASGGAAAASGTGPSSAAPAGRQTPAADPAAGQKIATSGNPAKGVIACVTCHGAQGEGNAASGFPRLASQSAAYLREQLDSYADGRRQNAIMAPIAKGLAPDERASVSAYYATLQGPAAAPGASAAPAQPGTAAQAGTPAQAGATAQGSASAQGGASPQGSPSAQSGASAQAADARKRGETLLKYGDESIHVQGCANCHGPGAAGEPPTYPYLAGQHAGYLAGALREFKSGTRTNDPTGQMTEIAKQLSDADIEAVSAYLAQLPPPVPGDAGTGAVRDRAAQGAAQPSPGQAGGSAPSGVGTEQGAPLTGGGQGPGGGGGGSGAGPSGSKSGH